MKRRDRPTDLRTPLSIVVTAYLYGASMFYVHAQDIRSQPPAPPYSPKSEKDCIQWSKNYRAFWTEKLKAIDNSDAECIRQRRRVNLPVLQTTTTEGCSNVGNARVSHKTPCGEWDKWQKCAEVEHERSIDGCYARLAEFTKQAHNRMPTNDWTVSSRVGHGTEFEPANPHREAAGREGAASEGIDYEAASRARIKKAYEWAADQNSVEAWEQFLDENPDGDYAQDAKKRLAELLGAK
jgi:hypothetical protein